MTYSTPSEFQVSDPKLIDEKIADIQSALMLLSWNEVSFARAYKFARRNVETNTKVYYPAVYQLSTKDYQSAFPNDMLTSQSFVYVKQPQTLDSENNGFHEYTTAISIIFSFRMRAIGTAYKYRYTERLKYDVVEALKNVSDLDIESVYDEIEDCFSDFSVSEIESEFITEQFGALRFDCLIHYSNDCKITNTY